MFTIKLYGADSHRLVIKEAESFTILRDSEGAAEITLHQKNPSDDSRIDINDEASRACVVYSPPCFDKAIIENAAGRTTEIIVLRPIGGVPGLPPKPMKQPPKDLSGGI